MPAAQEQFERVALVRLAALEKRTARLFWILVVVLVAFAWRELAFRPVVRGARFELVDDNGELRGLWQVQNDRPGLILRDDGGWRAELSSGRDSGRLRLYGNGTDAQLRAEPQGATLELLSGADLGAVVRAESTDGRTRMTLAPTQGEPIVLPPIEPR